MLRNFKKLISLVLVLALFATVCVPSFAAEKATTSQSENEVVVSEKYAKAHPLYGEHEVITPVGYALKTVTVTPSGQNSDGTRFSTGGGFYVNTDSGSSQSFSLSVGWGGVSVSVSVGIASTSSSVGGVYLSAPDTVHHFKAKIDKTLDIEHDKVDVYQYNTYQYTYYSDSYTVDSENVYVVQV